MSRKQSVRQHDLADYIQHAERFGPECVLQTAAGELSRDDLGKLKAFIDSKERSFRFKNGDWVERREAARRACAHCGLDLPLGSPSNKLYHSHCKSTAASQRERAQSAVGKH